MIRCDQTCRPFRPSCSIVSLNKKLHYRCVTICRVTPSFFPIYDSTIFLFLPTFPFLSFPFVSRSIGTRGTIKYAQLRVGFYFPKKPSDLRVSQETKVEQKKRKKFAFARSRGSIHARAKSRRCTACHRFERAKQCAAMAYHAPSSSSRCSISGERESRPIRLNYFIPSVPSFFRAAATAAAAAGYRKPAAREG